MKKKLLLLALGALALFVTTVLPFMSASGAVTAGTGSASGVAGLPAVLGQAYTQAATQVTAVVPTCQGMRWEILAGLAQVETTQASGHQISQTGQISPPIYGPPLDGTGTGGNTSAVLNTSGAEKALDGGGTYARAVGLFQFLPSTWLSDAVSARPGLAVADPQNAFDAALTAAKYLCGNGRDLTQPAQLEAAIYSYNHSTAYVTQVEAAIGQYEALATTTTVSATGQAKVVIQTALSQLGVPYSWGGGSANGPTRGQCCSPGGQNGSTITGFDCSGLTLYAYAQAGITLPRTAAEQAGVGHRIPASAGLSALRPGDLIFYGYIPGDNASIYHVAIYAGSGQQIAAPRPGEGVLVQPVDLTSSNYAGGTHIL